MEGPTITDWIQSATAGLALLIAVISLGWQIKNAYAARQGRLSLEVERWSTTTWKVDLSMNGHDRSSGLVTHIKIKGRAGQSLAYTGDLPWEPSSPYFILPRRDIRRASELPPAKSLRLRLDHESPPSTVASNEFALVVEEGTAVVRLSVSVFADGRLLPLIRKTMLISPTR